MIKNKNINSSLIHLFRLISLGTLNAPDAINLQKLSRHINCKRNQNKSNQVLKHPSKKNATNEHAKINI